MKSVILAAAMFVCAPAFAAEAATETTTTTTVTAPLTAEQCKAEFDKCADQACKDALVAKGCAAPAN